MGIPAPMITDLWIQQYIMSEANEQISGEQLSWYLLDQQKEQEKIIVEWFFDRAEWLGKIKYAFGCVWKYTKGCSSKSFDCSGLLRFYGLWKGILSEKEDEERSSNEIFSLGKLKDPREAKRGDFIFFLANGWSGNTVNHIGIVPKDFSGNGLWIYDNMTNHAEARELTSASCNKNFCYYAGKYKVFVATNGFVELAKKKGMVVKKYVDNKTLDENLVRQYLDTKWASKFADAFIKYGKANNIKPAMAVCIAQSETNIGKRMYATGNIANINSHQKRQFIFSDGSPDLDSAIEAIYTDALNGNALRSKSVVGDLYTNWQCKTNCGKVYATGKSAQWNVTQCLSRIYKQTISADRKYRY